jgi:hypothetical protein
MKILRIFTLGCILFVSYGCNAQKSEEETIVKMLKEFYIEYSGIWSIPSSDISPENFDKKLDSLSRKFCTQQLRKEAKEYLENGYDLFTNERGISNTSLSTLTITSSLKKYVYVVSYELNSSIESKIEKVFFNVTVVKEGENFKISSVTKPPSSAKYSN